MKWKLFPNYWLFGLGSLGYDTHVFPSQGPVMSLIHCQYKETQVGNRPCADTLMMKYKLHIYIEMCMYRCCRYWIGSYILPGIILWMCPANERWCYIVTLSLFGWVHTQNDPCIMPFPIILQGSFCVCVQPIRDNVAIVTSSFIGWVYIQNYSWSRMWVLSYVINLHATLALIVCVNCIFIMSYHVDIYYDEALCS